MQHTAHPTFEEVIEENKASIYRICKVYAISPIGPEDLFQEVTFHIWNNFSTFDGRARMSTWIYRIALNVCMRHKSSLERRKKMIRLEAIQFQLPEAVPDASMQEKYEALYDCVRSLNEIDKSIVILYLDEMPYKEIADITGLTENHIAVKMKRIRKALLTCLTSKLQ